VWKRAAAQAAVERDVTDGMTIGLGSGTTADLMLEALAERVRQGLHVTGVATSERTRSEAQRLNIPLDELDDVVTLHLSIDGADEVILPSLDLVKGRGGALLREKLVAGGLSLSMSRRWSARSPRNIRSPLRLIALAGVIPLDGWRHLARRCSGA
jgi:ribose 5-phosphate isomerase